MAAAGYSKVVDPVVFTQGKKVCHMIVPTLELKKWDELNDDQQKLLCERGAFYREHPTNVCMYCIFIYQFTFKMKSIQCIIF